MCRPRCSIKATRRKRQREDTSIRDENIQVSGGRLLEDITKLQSKSSDLLTSKCFWKCDLPISCIVKFGSGDNVHIFSPSFNINLCCFSLWMNSLPFVSVCFSTSFATMTLRNSGISVAAWGDTTGKQEIHGRGSQLWNSNETAMLVWDTLW